VGPDRGLNTLRRCLSVLGKEAVQSRSRPLERIAEAEAPFWCHVRDAVLAYREEREEED